MADELKDPATDEETRTPLPVEEDDHERGDDGGDSYEMGEVVERVVVVSAVAIDPFADGAGSIRRWWCSKPNMSSIVAIWLR